MSVVGQQVCMRCSDSSFRSMHSPMPSACFLRPVAVLWDIENCPVPHGLKSEDVAVHIRLALKIRLPLTGPVTVFSAYADFSRLSLRTRQGCQQTGVNLIDVPHGRKDAADKAILMDMFLFALDNPPPCTIVLISGDVDFAPALHKLGQRGYTMVVAIPSDRHVSHALCNACQHLWSWPDIVRGKDAYPMRGNDSYLMYKAPPKHVVGESTCRECTLASSIATFWKAPIDSEIDLRNAERVGGKGLASLTSAIDYSNPSKVGVGNVDSVGFDQVKGTDGAEECFVDGLRDNLDNFGKMEVGTNGNHSLSDVSKKSPVDMFVEHVKTPVSLVKEHTVTRAAMGKEPNRIAASEVPKEFVDRSVVMAMDCSTIGAGYTNRSMLPPACDTSYFAAPHGMVDNEHIAEGVEKHITSSGFLPCGGLHLSSQYENTHPGGALGALVGDSGKEAFGQAWKGLAYHREAEYRPSIAGVNHVERDAIVSPSGHASASVPAPHGALWLAERGSDSHRIAPPNRRHWNAQDPITRSGPITRSQSAQLLCTKFMGAKAAGSKQAGHGRGQDRPPRRLMTKKKKKQKAAAPGATAKLTKRQRKLARLAATPPDVLKERKKQRKARKLAAIQARLDFNILPLIKFLLAY